MDAFLVGLALARMAMAPPANPPQMPVVVRVLDEQVGKGRLAGLGDLVTIHLRAKYDEAVVYDTEKIGQPYMFVLGQKGIVPFLSVAVAGMRPHGERRVFVDKHSTGGTSGVRGLLPAGVPLTIDIKVLDVKQGE